MRGGVYLSVILCAVGCQSRSQANFSSPVCYLNQYEEKPAAALVFDPPQLNATPYLNLAREDRAPRAFVSYDELTTTFFSIRTNDVQSNEHGDFYSRRANIEKIGVSYR